MRNLITILTIVLLFMACVSSKSQTLKQPKVSFENQLSKTLIAINEAKNAKGLFENINKLKRLSNLYPKEWLSDYYVTLWDLKLSMRIKDKKKKESLLVEAKDLLDKLTEKNNINESEILTLKGYYYYALIAKDPQKNGQLYYKDLIGSYQKAMALDRTNPRPVLMLTIFKNKMSKFVGGDFDLCIKLENIEKMFKSLNPKNGVNPEWGIKELRKEQQKSCTSKP